MRRFIYSFQWRVLLALTLSFGWVTAVAAKSPQDVWSGVDRIVAIGDLEGDYDQIIDILRATKLVDRRAKWIGGKAHLVQIGDVVDRGDNSRKLMDYLMKLEGQARKAGGAVHVLIGNHEAMNVYGDLRYTTPGEFAAYKESNSREIRDHYYEQHQEELRKNPPAEGLPAFDDAYRKEWESTHPLGWYEHRFFFGPNGKYGKWIRSLNTVIKVNDTLFIHAGISPVYANRAIREINDQVRLELNDFSLLQGGMVLAQDGPLWYRGLVRGEQNLIEEHLSNLLTSNGAVRIVIGHTTTEGAVMPRFGGRVLQVDVGLSEYRGRRWACLVVEGEEAYALHRGEKLDLPGDSEVALLEYLKKAAALDPQPSPLEAQIKKLEAGLAVSVPPQ